MKKGMYKIATCRAMLSAIAPTRKRFFHSGSLNRLSFSESEFIALNISTVTRMDSDIVVAVFAISFVNISQPISGNRLEHWWKCVCDRAKKLVSPDKKHTNDRGYTRAGKTRFVGHRYRRRTTMHTRQQLRHRRRCR